MKPIKKMFSPHKKYDLLFSVAQFFGGITAFWLQATL